MRRQSIKSNKLDDRPRMGRAIIRDTGGTPLNGIQLAPGKYSTRLQLFAQVCASMCSHWNISTLKNRHSDIRERENCLENLRSINRR